MTGIDQQWTLYCPHCEYNLTGLRENRCPECGKEFDPKVLRARVLWTTAPIGVKSFAIGIVWPAAVLWAAIGVMLFASLFSFVFVTVLITGLAGFVILGMLLAQPVNAFSMAERIAMSWPKLQGCSLWGPRGRLSVLALGLGIYLLELMATAIPTLVLWPIFHLIA